MGIKNLVTTCEKVFRYTPKKAILADISNSYVSVDANLYMFNFSYDKSDFLTNFLVMIMNMFENDIVPIFAFGGTRPVLKEKECQRRKERIEQLRLNIEHARLSGNIEKYNLLQKQNFDITTKDYELLSELLDCLCIPSVTIHDHESEGFCVWLNKKGYCQHVFSNDSDVFAYGATSVVKNYTNNQSFLLYDGYKFRSSLNYDYRYGKVFPYGFENEDKFLDYCLLLGTDFNDRCFGPKIAYKNICDLSVQQCKEFVSNKIALYDQIVAEFKADYSFDTRFELFKTKKPYELLHDYIALEIDIKKIQTLFCKSGRTCGSLIRRLENILE